MKRNRSTFTAALCAMTMASFPAFSADDGRTPRSGSSMGHASPSTAQQGGASGTDASGRHAFAMDAQKVSRIQQALADKGHDPGPIDGVMGPRTRSALQDYQRSQNITAGGLDARTLESLGLQADATDRSHDGSSGASGGSSGGKATGGGSGMTPETPRGNVPGGNSSRTGSSSSPSGVGTGTPR